MTQPKNKLDMHLRVIIEKLRDFFSCEVKLNEDLKKHKPDDVLSFELKHKSDIYQISFIRKDIGKTSNKTIYKEIVETINKNYDSNSLQDYDENFLKTFISKRLSSQKNSPTNILYIIDYFDKLRTTSFEGDYFSTAMILSSKLTIEKYKENYSEYGSENLIGISRYISLYDKIDRRFWYLIDGKNSFYVCNEFLNISRVLTLDDSKSTSFITNHMLSDNLNENEILFRINNENEYSVISNKQEFTYIENKWKYRNYEYIEKLFKDYTSLNDSCITSLLFFVFYCSRNSISTILWLPDDMSEIENKSKSKSVIKSKNTFLNPNSQAQIKIDNKKYKSIIMRIISSDGVTVFDKKGILRYYGCVVNIDYAKIYGVVGTGEMATKIISNNGVAIKISQDSTIKLFLDEENKIEI